MFNTNIILTFNLQNEHDFEHDFEHDLQMEKNFSTPKIYTAKGDLKKRWYVYFSFRNPKTGNLVRMKNIYGDVNKYKTKEDRLFVLSIYRRKLLELLKVGFNPFEDNTELYQKRLQEKKGVVSEKSTSVINSSGGISTNPQPAVATAGCEADNTMTLKKAFDFALTIKKKTVSDRTYNEYRRKAGKFLHWIEKFYPSIITVDQLSKKVLQQFLNHVLKQTSARSRNNDRADLSSLMQVLVDNEIIATNFLIIISVLKSNPTRNKTYTKGTQEDIFNYLKEKDPHLLLFIKFISYNFLRPIEVCRIKIKDINLKQKTISFRAKNKPLKTKIIPDILIKELPDLNNLNPEDYLFTPTSIGGKWDTSENNKRNYFSKQYKKVVKTHFNLGKEYGLYSFRHTYITKLYRELRKTTTPFEAKSRLILITGHSTMTSLEKYLRDIDAELPEDYSILLI